MISDEVIARARALLRRGRTVDAVSTLLAVTEDVHLADASYDEAMRMLASALASTGRPSAAASIWLYLGRGEALHELPDVAPGDRARAEIARAQPRLLEAARAFERQGFLGHASVHADRAGRPAESWELWSRWFGAKNGPQRTAYVEALAFFNRGRAARRLGRDDEAHRDFVRSVQWLEEAADAFETAGQRDRAFDCYQMLLAVGHETGSFENVAEGALNCIRILRADHLKYHAFQYYEDFVRHAVAAGEHHAAALALHDAAAHARALGLPFQTALAVREIDAWRRVATTVLPLRGGASMAENALLAAASASAEMGAVRRASTLFVELAALPIEPARVERYAALARHFATCDDEVVQGGELPDEIVTRIQYPDIWHDDVLEWENGGDVVAVTGDVLCDPVVPAYPRRLALAARLILQVDGGPESATALARAVQRLGMMQLYAVLSVLEHLARRPETDVRAAVQRASQRLLFKRTFGILQQGVLDPEAEVREAARTSVSGMVFAHAFDALARLHRDSADDATRRAALQAIGRIHTPEALEYLLDVATRGAAADRTQAATLAAHSGASEVDAVITRRRATASADERVSLDRIRSLRHGR